MKVTVTKWQFCLLLGAVLTASRPVAAADPESAVRTAAFPQKHDVEEQLCWLDDVHCWLFEGLQGQITRADELSVETDEDKLAVSNSTFELSMDFKIGYNEKSTVLDFDPDFEADLVLPNLERRWNVYLNNMDLDNVSNQKEREGDRSLFAGLRRVIKQSKRGKLDASAGIKWNSHPETFFRVDYKYRWKGENWKVYPQQRIYWIDGEGFGETTALQLDYWLTDCILTRSDSVLTWSESTRGCDWEESLSLAYICEEDKSEMRKTLGLILTAFGHHNGHYDTDIDKYRARLVYRRPFYKDWLYVRYSPQVQWLQDRESLEENEDERVTYSFLVGIDMLLFGTE